MTENPSPKAAPPMPKFRILVMDNYADAAESLMMLLQMEGYEVETAKCGMKAVELAQVRHPQVILLDVKLSHLNGHEVAKRLPNPPGNRDVILIALTGLD